MISITKIKIFDSYNGDLDRFERVGLGSEKKLLDKNDWSLIENFYQDIELINKRLAVQTFLNEIITKLKINCENESFDFFTSRIEYFKDFQDVAGILKQVRSFITKDTDTVWAGFNNPDEFLNELNQDIEKIENCNWQALEKVRIEFLPTCTYQDLSLSNGWSDQYFMISSEFDKIYERMHESKILYNITSEKTWRLWLKKIFRL